MKAARGQYKESDVFLSCVSGTVGLGFEEVSRCYLRVLMAVVNVNQFPKGRPLTYPCSPTGLPLCPVWHIDSSSPRAACEARLIHSFLCVVLPRDNNRRDVRTGESRNHPSRFACTETGRFQIDTPNLSVKPRN